MPTAITTDNAKRALLDHLIDDASLFPPAELGMEAAIRAHLRHRESAYSWAGGTFVVPASRLGEFAQRHTIASSIALSVILDAGAAGAKGDVVLADLERVERIKDHDHLKIAGFEFRAPAGVDAANLSRLLTLVAERHTEPVSIWVEPTYAAGWTQPTEATMALLAAARSEAAGNVTIGAKLRCGGLAAGTTPTDEDLAAFLTSAQTHGVPWKATAGLHHPVRGTHHGRDMHGFLNLFIAGIALHAGAVQPDGIAAILAETDARAFVVDPQHIGWTDLRVEAASVAAARAHCTGYGSCSFDEPINDLRELGLLA
jgi:hypothetical protein